MIKMFGFAFDKRINLSEKPYMSSFFKLWYFKYWDKFKTSSVKQTLKKLFHSLKHWISTVDRKLSVNLIKNAICIWLIDWMLENKSSDIDWSVCFCRSFILCILRLFHLHTVPRNSRIFPTLQNCWEFGEDYPHYID